MFILIIMGLSVPFPRFAPFGLTLLSLLILSRPYPVKGHLGMALCNGLITAESLGLPWVHLFLKTPLRMFSAMSLMLPVMVWTIPFSLPTWIWASLFAWTGAVLCCVERDAAFLAFVFSCGIGGLRYVFPCKNFLTILQVLWTLLVLSSPCFSLLTFDHIDDLHKTTLKDHGHIHRLYIWKVVSDQILEKPWLGYGFKASSTEAFQKAYEPFARTTLIHPKTGGRYPIGDIGKDFSVHPHHMFLQIWLEFGLLGVLFFIGLCLWGLQILKRCAHETTIKALGMLVSYFFYTGISINPWSSISLSMLFFIVVTIREMEQEKGFRIRKIP